MSNYLLVSSVKSLQGSWLLAIFHCRKIIIPPKSPKPFFKSASPADCGRFGRAVLFKEQKWKRKKLSLRFHANRSQ
jgi:hypothetical protein